jgi:hypothetical protein
VFNRSQIAPRRARTATTCVGVFALVALLELASCGGIKVGLDQSTQGTVTDAATKLRDGLDKVSDGLKGLDPFALNKLLNDNADLRKKLEDVTRSLNAAAGTGMIEIANRAIQIRVVSYTGAFSVTGWLDKRENWFWQSRTFPNLGFSWGDEAQLIAAIRQQSNSQFPGNGDSWDHIARTSLTLLAPKVKDFLQANTVVPGPQADSIDLNTSLGSVSGQHKIFIEVTPTAVDPASGKWAIRLQTILKRPNGDIEVIRETDLTSDDHSGHPLHQALAVDPETLIVKVSQ